MRATAGRYYLRLMYPNPGKAVHVLSIDGMDASPDSALLLATARFYRLKSASADAIAQPAVCGWEQKARALGLGSAEISRTREVIDPAHKWRTGRKF